MKTTWGIGILVAVLLSFGLYFLGVVGTVPLALGSIFLLSGLWTLVSGFFIASPKDRTYYGSWGVFLACLSLFAVVSVAYAVGATMLAIVGIIVVVLFQGRGQKTPPTPASAQQAGGSPVAG